MVGQVQPAGLLFAASKEANKRVVLATCSEQPLLSAMLAEPPGGYFPPPVQMGKVSLRPPHLANESTEAQTSLPGVLEL